MVGAYLGGGGGGTLYLEKAEDWALGFRVLATAMDGVQRGCPMP